ncbi:AKL18 protein [Puccinia sorghi]|uniref:AKL18 protein n=1 Tax=Puccinia sorghi TaxID=27349 RepID=A0A0L6UMI6_9BASI|nr:AKL18 protein [Puccinia sorghi]
MPPPPSDPATEMRSKRDEAIARARELYGHPAPAPTPTFQPSYPSQVMPATLLATPNQLIPGQNIMGIQASPQILSSAYQSARAQRLSTQPYPVSRPKKAIVKPGGKSAVSLEITQRKLSIQCGFEMWYRSKWARGQAILHSSSTVIPSDPNCILVLIQEL